MLRTIEQLPSNAEQKVGGLVVVAGDPYYSASGRTCRRVTLRGQQSGTPETRLACRLDEGWVFVPDVFGSSLGG